MKVIICLSDDDSPLSNVGPLKAKKVCLLRFIPSVEKKKKHRRKVLSWSSNPFTNKHLHLVTARHWRAGRTLYNASLCCDYTTASPTPNWQALSAGSMLGMGLGGVCVCVCVCMCVCVKGAGCDITTVTGAQRAQKLAQAFCQWPAPPRPSLFVGVCHPQRPRSAAPRPDSRSVSPPLRPLASYSQRGLV